MEQHIHNHSHMFKLCDLLTSVFWPLRTGSAHGKGINALRTVHLSSPNSRPGQEWLCLRQQTESRSGLKEPTEKDFQ